MEGDLEREQLQKEIEQIQLILNLQPTFSVIRDTSSENNAIEDDESDRDSSDLDPELTSELSRSGIIPIENLSRMQKEDAATPDDNLFFIEAGLGNENGPELCLELNLAYQQHLQESLNRVQLAIAENRERQFQIKSQMKTSSSKKNISRNNDSEGQIVKKVSLQHSTPYFRFTYSSNKQLFQTPPPNYETREKKFNGYRNVWEMPTQKWKEREKKALKEGIKADGMKKFLQPLMNKQELYKQKFATIKQNNQEKNDMENKIKEIQNEIDSLMSGTTEEELLGEQHRECDWQKISKIDLNEKRSPAECTHQWQFIQHPSINNNPWTNEEDDNLLEIAENYQYRNWVAIATELQTNRTAFQCIRRYQKHLNKDLAKKNWTEEEDQLLMHIVENFKVGNKIPFTKVAYFLEGHTPRQVFCRWRLSINPEIKHGPFLDEEDRILLEQVKKLSYGGKIFWSKIAKKIPGRTNVQIRNRYVFKHARKKTGFWNDEEEIKLIELINKYGEGNWTKISKEFKNRIPNQLLKHYSLMVGKAVEELMNTNNINEINDMGRRLLKVLCDKNEMRLKQILEKVVYQKINEKNLPKKTNKNTTIAKRMPKCDVVIIESTLNKIMAIRAQQHIPQDVFTPSEHRELFTILLKDLRININGAAISLERMYKGIRVSPASTSTATFNQPSGSFQAHPSHNSDRPFSENGRPINSAQNYSTNIPSLSPQPTSYFIPYMPPNIATMNAFRKLLLNKMKLYQNSLKLNINGKKTLGECKAFQVNHVPIKNTVKDMLEARRKQKLISCMSTATATTSADPGNSTHVTAMHGNNKQDLTTQLKNSPDYQIMESRFLSLFLWPAYLSGGSWQRPKASQDNVQTPIGNKRKQDTTSATIGQEAVPDLAKKIRVD